MSQRYDRPDYYKPWKGDFPEDSVIMVNDSSLLYHSRRFMTGSSVALSAIQNVRRHRNIDFIYDVQVGATLDVDVLRETDCLILKEPSVLQVPLERPVIQAKYEEVEEKGIKWDKSNAYVFTHKKQFMLTNIEPPHYWNEDISRDDITRKESIVKRIW